MCVGGGDIFKVTCEIQIQNTYVYIGVFFNFLIDFVKMLNSIIQSLSTDSNHKKSKVMNAKA